MRASRAFGLVLGLAVGGTGAWGLYYAGAIGPAAALRLGGGLCAGVLLVTFLPLLWPSTSAPSPLEQALDAPPPSGPPRPRSLREVEMAVRLACAKHGGLDARYRLGPQLRRVALHRLRARGVEGLASEEARELLGEDLWAFLQEDGLGNRRGDERALPAATLARWVERLESL